MRGRVFRLIGKEGRKEGGKRVNNGRGDILIPAKAARGPRTRLARCSGAWFPDAGLPSSHLLL